jgi:hypothetical protein
MKQGVMKTEKKPVHTFLSLFVPSEEANILLVPWAGVATSQDQRALAYIVGRAGFWCVNGQCINFGEQQGLPLRRSGERDDVAGTASRQFAKLKLRVKKGKIKRGEARPCRGPAA